MSFKVLCVVCVLSVSCVGLKYQLHAVHPLTMPQRKYIGQEVQEVYDSFSFSNEGELLLDGARYYVLKHCTFPSTYAGTLSSMPLSG